MNKSHIFATLLILTSACVTEQKTSPTAGASWYNTMHRLSANHTAITPLLADPGEFYNPKNTATLKEKTNQMLLAANEMVKNSDAPNADPIIGFVTKQFAQDLKATSQMLDMGKLEAAHYNLSQISNYCISCHTRADRGNKDYPIAWIGNVSRMSQPDKALYYLANRQYASAHKQVDDVIKDPKAIPQDLNRWMNVIKKDLAVTIRVQEDLPRAQQLTEQLLSNKNIPAYIKTDAQLWKKSILEWQKESSKKIKTTEIKKLELVKNLVDKARVAPYSEGNSALIIYLRASGILHGLLEESSATPSYSPTLYYAGLTAEALKSVDVWNLGEHYFEVCIENSPNTVVAQKCYRQLEHLVQQAHPNMHLIPEFEKSIQLRLAKYKDLAFVINPSMDLLRKSERGPNR
ncbi:MAG: hypothetical protein IT287_05365 [Bdellovibrionaceae bacterium]|nr:hypothetical protein [Pseudobdellovibrionaceae bacterium]